jgi:hypothetical protein
MKVGSLYIDPCHKEKEFLKVETCEKVFRQSQIGEDIFSMILVI